MRSAARSDEDPGPRRRVADDLSTVTSPPAPEPALGRRHHVPAYLAGLPLPGRGDGLLSRKVVGWSMADHLRAELVVDALEWPARRRPARDRSTTPTRARNTPRLASAAMPRGRDAQSMGQGRLLRQRRRRELLRHPEDRAAPPPVLAPADEAKTAVFDYIETCYNRRRRHSPSATSRPSSTRRSLRRPNHDVSVQAGELHTSAASGSCARSSRRTSARRPLDSTSRAVPSAPARSRCHVMPRSNPASASATAVALPIPESEPVTIATGTARFFRARPAR